MQVSILREIQICHFDMMPTERLSEEGHKYSSPLQPLTAFNFKGLGLRMEPRNHYLKTRNEFIVYSCINAQIKRLMI